MTERQAPGAQLQLLQNRAQYEQTTGYQANGHQEMFDSLGERAERRQNLTGVHRFNLPEETMDYMISMDKALLRSDDDDVDTDMNRADDAPADLAFSTPPTPFSVQRAQMELARVDSVRAQMAVNDVKRYLNHIEEADKVSQRQMMRLTHENASDAELQEVAHDQSQLAAERSAWEEKLKQAEQEAESTKEILADLTQKLEAAENDSEPPAKRRRTGS